MPPTIYHAKTGTRNQKSTNNITNEYILACPQQKRVYLQNFARVVSFQLLTLRKIPAREMPSSSSEMSSFSTKFHQFWCSWKSAWHAFTLSTWLLEMRDPGQNVDQTSPDRHQIIRFQTNCKLLTNVRSKYAPRTDLMAGRRIAIAPRRRITLQA